MVWSSQPKDCQSTASFQPLQIVYLEHETIRLYAEVVQTAEGRQICWVRPLALVEDETKQYQAEYTFCFDQILDLRQGSDLLLPAVLFRMALDTEALPVLAMLGATPPPENLQSITRLRLNQFVKQVCMANPDLFSSEV
ncbi:MAG: hypothetical protein IGS48_20315 [Oscillatoriales cyanobacterium C42_A2020_001]|nr:hypothetical protein [Leptolyngbyaceae cyanobacterium C42_A2020_001]